LGSNHEMAFKNLQTFRTYYPFGYLKYKSVLKYRDLQFFGFSDFWRFNNYLNN